MTPDNAGKATNTPIEIVENVNTQMLARMEELRIDVKKTLSKSPVIVAEFSHGGGKFTLLRDGLLNLTEEPVPPLFALAKTAAHAPLGMYACIGAYIEPFGQGEGWRVPLEAYKSVLQNASFAVPSIDAHDFGLDHDDLNQCLADELNTLPVEFSGTNLTLEKSDVPGHVKGLLQDFLAWAVTGCEQLLAGGSNNLSKTFDEWCNDSKENYVYESIVQCEVISVVTQRYGIFDLIGKWKTLCKESWKDLYVVVGAQWPTREQNSIAQCILPLMEDKEKALNEKLLVLTGLSGVDAALDLLTVMLADRAAADLILDNQHDGLPKAWLSGQIDLLGPVMGKVTCPHVG